MADNNKVNVNPRYLTYNKDEVQALFQKVEGITVAEEANVHALVTGHMREKRGQFRTNAQKKGAETVPWGLVSTPERKAASYSPALHRSTIGVGGLNFSVRNGKRWGPATIATQVGVGISDTRKEARPTAKLRRDKRATTENTA